ncbi:hypothetical protein TthAA220_11670 [Thermus thermophilus]|nr:hypothetical protein TthAA220_11670 [Thermus thermophilus]
MPQKGAAPPEGRPLEGQEEEAKAHGQGVPRVEAAKKGNPATHRVQEGEDEEVEQGAPQDIPHGDVHQALDGGAAARDELGQGGGGGHQDQAHPRPAPAPLLRQGVPVKGHPGPRQHHQKGHPQKGQEGHAESARNLRRSKRARTPTGFPSSSTTGTRLMS